MIRQHVVLSLREMAKALGEAAEGSQWHIFGSVDRDDPNALDIDLQILCKNDEQADFLRQAIDPDALMLPLHLAFFTYEEAAGIDAVSTQRSRAIYP
jgi:hypothetical protein